MVFTIFLILLPQIVKLVEYRMESYLGETNNYSYQEVTKLLFNTCKQLNFVNTPHFDP